VEHEVSVITALQAMDALDVQKYEVVPIYITKSGEWLTGAALRRLETYQANNDALRSLARVALSPVPGQGFLQAVERSRLLPFGGSSNRLGIDIAFPCMHGTFGEDGTLQGLFELADLPYVGPGVLAAALGMDKIAMKAAFRTAGLPVVNWMVVSRETASNPAVDQIAEIERQIGYPAFVKPANLGSSVGIGKASDRDSLTQALAVAAHFDRRVLVEVGLDGAVDVQCSVLGHDDDLRVSVCEQPITWQAFYSYEEKYIQGGKAQGMKGAARRIPAPIGEQLTAQVQTYAKEAFRAIDSAGVARIDCLITPDEKVYVNEINTIPGSLSFYLWEATDLSFPRLLDRLIDFGLARHQARKDTTYSIDSALLRKTLEGSGKARR
jgi:D-alanine-D-alanine ligase